MTNSPEWYDAVAAAIARRDRALKGIARWQQTLEQAQAEIASLAAEGGEPVQATEPVPVQE